MFPLKVWLLVVTAPPLLASAGARLNTPEVIEAPFVVGVALIEPTEIELPVEVLPSAIKYWDEVPVGVLNPAPVILALVFTSVTYVLPNCILLLESTIAPLPMAVALVNPSVATLAEKPIAVLLVPVILLFNAEFPRAVL